MKQVVKKSGSLSNLKTWDSYSISGGGGGLGGGQGTNDKPANTLPPLQAVTGRGGSDILRVTHLAASNRAYLNLFGYCTVTEDNPEWANVQHSPPSTVQDCDSRLWLRRC